MSARATAGLEPTVVLALLAVAVVLAALIGLSVGAFPVTFDTLSRAVLRLWSGPARKQPTNA